MGLINNGPCTTFEKLTILSVSELATPYTENSSVYDQGSFLIGEVALAKVRTLMNSDFVPPGSVSLLPRSVV